MHVPQDSRDMRPSGPRPVKNSSAPRCTVAAGVPAAGSADERAVATTLRVARSITLTERLTKLPTHASVPAWLITIERGALPASLPGPGFSRSTRTMAPPPGVVGPPIVGMPSSLIVRRTIMFDCWMTTQASEPSGRQAMPMGLVQNSRGTFAWSLGIPWSRFSGAVWKMPDPTLGLRTSLPVVRSSTETRPWASTLNRNGPFGEGAVLTTYANGLVG